MAFKTKTVSPRKGLTPQPLFKPKPPDVVVVEGDFTGRWKRSLTDRQKDLLKRAGGELDEEALVAKGLTRNEAAEVLRLSREKQAALRQDFFLGSPGGPNDKSITEEQKAKSAREKREMFFEGDAPGDEEPSDESQGIAFENLSPSARVEPEQDAEEAGTGRPITPSEKVQPKAKRGLAAPPSPYATEVGETILDKPDNSAPPAQEAQRDDNGRFTAPDVRRQLFPSGTPTTEAREAAIKGETLPGGITQKILSQEEKQDVREAESAYETRRKTLAVQYAREKQTAQRAGLELTETEEQFVTRALGEKDRFISDDLTEKRVARASAPTNVDTVRDVVLDLLPVVGTVRAGQFLAENYEAMTPGERAISAGLVGLSVAGDVLFFVPAIKVGVTALRGGTVVARTTAATAERFAVEAARPGVRTVAIAAVRTEKEIEEATKAARALRPIKTVRAVNVETQATKAGIDDAIETGRIVAQESGRKPTLVINVERGITKAQTKEIAEVVDRQPVFRSVIIRSSESAALSDKATRDVAEALAKAQLGSGATAKDVAQQAARIEGTLKGTSGKGKVFQGEKAGERLAKAIGQEGAKSPSTRARPQLKVRAEHQIRQPAKRITRTKKEVMWEPEGPFGSFKGGDGGIAVKAPPRGGTSTTRLGTKAARPSGLIVAVSGTGVSIGAAARVLLPEPTGQPTKTPGRGPSITPTTGPGLRPGRGPGGGIQPTPAPPKTRPATRPGEKPQTKTRQEPGGEPSIRPGIKPTVTTDKEPSITPGGAPGVETGVTTRITPSVEPGTRAATAAALRAQPATETKTETKTKTKTKGVARIATRFRLPSGATLEPGEYPRVVEITSGVSTQRIDLDTGQRRFTATPKGQETDPLRPSFRVVSTDDTPPVARRLRMGVVDLVISPVAVDVLPRKDVADQGRLRARLRAKM